MREKYTAVYTDSYGERKFSIIELEIINDLFSGKDIRKNSELDIKGNVTAKGSLEGKYQDAQGIKGLIKMEKTPDGYKGTYTGLEAICKSYEGSIYWKRIK